MSAGSHAASLVKRFAVSEDAQLPDVYFRSKLFTTASTTNPLVAAAGPLFSLLERLCVSPTLPPLEIIRDNIAHELCAYRSRLQHKQYTADLTTIANYLLSATLDELLGKNYMRVHGQCAEFKSFTPSSADGTGPEKRFFDIIQYIKEQSNQYLDLIELAYYCLIAGFEGEQHLNPDGRQTLDHLIEELYQIIQKSRVHKPCRLFKKTSPTKQPQASHISHNMLLIITGTIALLAVLSAYFTSHVILNHEAQNILSTQIRLGAVHE